MNLCEQKHTSQVHLLKLRNIIAVLKKRLSVIVLSCKPVMSKNVIFVDQTQPASQPASHPELYRLQCSTLHKCNVDAKIELLTLYDILSALSGIVANLAIVFRKIHSLGNYSSVEVS